MKLAVPVKRPTGALSFPVHSQSRPLLKYRILVNSFLKLPGNGWRESAFTLICLQSVVALAKGLPSALKLSTTTFTKRQPLPSVSFWPNATYAVTATNGDEAFNYHLHKRVAPPLRIVLAKCDERGDSYQSFHSVVHPDRPLY
ncbi:hypothetical protein ACJRO7_021249 [Eucalyptus globulus]|uniref:Uncharacterized protein n=1 Tax=Eucalyptus globulus TaxID=34317 RepID=A0ABD3KQC3_EUCGL